MNGRPIERDESRPIHKVTQQECVCRDRKIEINKA